MGVCSGAAGALMVRAHCDGARFEREAIVAWHAQENKTPRKLKIRKPVKTVRNRISVIPTPAVPNLQAIRETPVVSTMFPRAVAI